MSAKPYILTLRYELDGPINETPMLPFRFKNGSVLEQLTMACPDCQEDAKLENTHGTLRRVKDSLFMRGVAFCEPCNQLFQGNALIIEDPEVKGFRMMHMTDRDIDEAERLKAL